MKKIKLLLMVLVLSICKVSFAQEYKLVIDQYLSPYSGSSYINTGYNFLKFLDDRYLPTSAGQTDFLWCVGRTSKLAGEFVLSNFLLVIQHEIFGHGYRVRELHMGPVSFGLHIFTGHTRFYIPYAVSNLNLAAISAAGIEANTILSQQIRQSWFDSGRIDNRDTMPYAINQLEQIRYAYSSEQNYGDDIASYVSYVNQYYGNNVLSINKIRSYVLWDLFDPALYYSFYGMGKYIYDGTAAIPMYMFNIDKYRYLPAGRTILAPYGVEFQLQNFVITPQKAFIQINLRYGKNSNINSYGLDFYFTPIYTYGNFVVGDQLSFWRQPNLSYPIANATDQQFGIANFVYIEYSLAKKAHLIMDFGYKTSGFIQGFLLSNGVFWRIGCRW